MFHSSTLRIALCLVIGEMLSTSCIQQQESDSQIVVPDDFTNLKVFEFDLSHMCEQHPEMRCFPILNVGVAGGHVISISIDGRGRNGQDLNQLPKSIYQFHHLAEFSLLSTAFEQLPDLRPFKNLRKVTIQYNVFRGPVHLRNLPSSMENLVLSRDGVEGVIVDDSLPHLSTFDLTQNLMEGRINSTFCKLPNLELLDISSGCCLSEAQQTARANAAKKMLCSKKVFVSANRSFID